MNNIMKLYGLLVFNGDHKLIYDRYNLNDFYFFMRGKIEDTIKKVSPELIKYVKLNSGYKINQTIEKHNFVAYILSSDKFYIVLTDDIYHERVALTLLHTLKNLKFNKSEFDNLFDSYLNPGENDKILKLQSELDATKLVLLDSIEALINRGESADELLKRTEVLKDSSFLLRKKSNELNSCCILF